MDYVPGTGRNGSRIMAIKTSYDVKIDQSLLAAHLRDYTATMGKQMYAVITNQAALFCLDMVKYSAPFSGSPGTGGTTAAKLKAAEQIKSQINAVFKPLEKANPKQVASLGSPFVFAEWITFFKNEKNDMYLLNNRRRFKWQIFGNKFAGSAGGNRIIDSMDDLKKTHEAIRYNRFGPIKRSVKKRGMQFIVKRPSMIKDLIQQKTKNIGIQKSAYYFSAKNVGDITVKFPTWVQQVQGQLSAIAVPDWNPLKPSVTVGNQIGRVVDSRYQYVLNSRAAAMRKQMKSYLNSKKITLADAVKSGKIYGTAPLFSE